MKGDFNMFIFIIVFSFANAFIGNLFGFIFANPSAIYNMLALAIFACIALTFVREVRRIAWVGVILSIILYASVQVIAPHAVETAMMLSFIATVPVTIFAKRRMLYIIRRNRAMLPRWARVVLTVL